MNRRGSISIFLIIMSSVIITTFLILFQYFSLALAETDMHRSVNLVSRNILADYDDSIYDKFGILAYEQSTSLSIEKALENTFNNFSSPLNMYVLETVDVNYTTVGMDNSRGLLEQIIFFTKNKISLNMAKDLFKKIGNSNLYIEKTKEIQSKLNGNKGYEQLKKIHRNISSSTDSVESFERNAHSYLEVIETYQKTIKELKNIDIANEVKDLKNGIEGLKKEYQNSYEKITLEYESVNKILKLKKEISSNKKKLKRARSDESLDADKKSKKIKRLRKQIASLKKEVKEEIDGLNRLISEYNKAISFKERIVELKNSIQSVKEKIGYGTIQVFDKSVEMENLTFDNRLLLNEYILGTFKSIVTSNYRDFDFYQKKERSSHSNGEVEYILKGYKETYKNVAAVSKDVFLIREGMNLAHLFIDHEKREFIFNTAKTPAIGIFASAAMTGLWTTAESSIDLFKIYSGNGTPLLKLSDKTFVLDLETIINGAAINYNTINKEQMVHYQDYLRLFLYNLDDSLKMNRVLDVIHTEHALDSLVIKHQINAKYRLKNKLTGATRTVEVTVIGEYVYE